MSAIEDYINNYKEKSGLKNFNNVSYASTSQVVSKAQVSNVTEPTTINKSYWSNVFLLIPVLLLVGFYSYKSFSKSALTIVPFLIVLIIMALFVRKALQKQGSPDMEVYADREKLIIEKQTFEWANIVNAYIMTDNTGKTTGRFLLLETKNQGIVSIYINKLSADRKQLAAIIEHYKKY